MDQNLLSLVRQELKELIKGYTKVNSVLALHSKRLPQVQETVTGFQDEPFCKRAKLDEHDVHLDRVDEKLQKEGNTSKEETELIMERLVSIEKILSESLASTNIKVKEMEQGFARTEEKKELLQQGFAKTDDKGEELEQGFAKTDDKVEELEQGFAKTDDRVEQLEQGSANTEDKVEQLEQGFARTEDEVEHMKQGFAKTDDKVEQLEQESAKTDDRVEQLEQESAKTDDRVEQLEQGFAKTATAMTSPMETFNVKTCQRKLKEHYLKTAKVPTSAGSSTCQVDLDQIYTRLSMVKDEQASAGSSQKEISHYIELFSEKTKNGAAPKRILVQGEIGIGKTTFVKKLLLDWSNLDDAKIKDAEERKDAQKKFNDDEVTSSKDDEDVIEDNEESSADNKDKEEDNEDGAKMDEEQKDAPRMFNGDELTSSKSDEDTAEDTEESGTNDESSKIGEDIEVTEESSTDDESSKGDEDVTENTEESNTDDEDMDEDSEGGAKMDEEQKDALRKFELVVAINLKEVCECQTLKEVISVSHLFPKEDESSIDDLLCYIYKNQDKVLFVLDGYDDYRTGSEAKVYYGSRNNSPIYNMFHGNDLKDCTVLVTTRYSRADELQGSADTQVKITGYNSCDRKVFIRKMLDSEPQIENVLEFIYMRNLEDLARVPLLTQLFCLLAKEEKTMTEYNERRNKLYQAIVEHILQHGHRKHPSSQVPELNEKYHEEILAEIGKVALAGLFKGDLVFKYGQLPEKVRGEESVIIGLFQLSKYARSLESMEMIPLIRDYSAAWYITYRCVPNGNLGRIEQHAGTLEDCLSLTNVLQFICGLSDDGAVKVFQHLKSIRISDPTLDFSTTVPDVENETNIPLFDVTERHEWFSDLVLNSFHEVQSRNELFRLCLDCTFGIVIVPRSSLLSYWMPEVKDLTREAHSGVFILVDECSKYNCYEPGRSDLLTTLEFLECLDVPLKVTEYSEVLKAGEFLKKFLNVQCVDCSFKCLLCFPNGQCQLYITDLDLYCDHHVRLLTETTANSNPSISENLLSIRSCLTFLKTLTGTFNSRKILKNLGAIVRDCKYLKEIEFHDSNDCGVCDLLEQVLNPSTGSLKNGPVSLSIHGRLTTDAVKLAALLPNFNVIRLYLDLDDCSAAEVNTLVSSITHKTPEALRLRNISLTPAAAAALGRSLPEMSSLQELYLSGRYEEILQDEDIEALFGGFNKESPLRRLEFYDFKVKGSLSPLINSLRFFPKLKSLFVHVPDTDNLDLHGLLENCRLIPSLRELSLAYLQGHAVTSFIQHIDNLPELELLYVDYPDCSEEDLNYVREELKQKRPRLRVDFNKID